MSVATNQAVDNNPTHRLTCSLTKEYYDYTLLNMDTFCTEEITQPIKKGRQYLRKRGYWLDVCD